MSNSEDNKIRIKKQILRFEQQKLALQAKMDDLKETIKKLKKRL